MNELIQGPPGPGWIWNGTEWVCAPCEPPCMPPPPGPPPWYPPPQGQPPWYPGANGGVAFGQTPPPNPIRGAFWFDGNALHLFDGAVWVDVGVQGAASGGGTATGTQPPTNPVDGSLWFNGSTLYIWDGNAWVPTAATKTYIQSTAPPAPNAGDQWWNGATMFIWDGSKWNPVGPGQAAGPVPTTSEVFSITNTGTLSIGINTWGMPQLTSTPTIDTTNAWDGGTRKIQPKTAGYYFFEAQAYLQGNGTAGSYEGLALLKNDTGVMGTSYTQSIAFAAASLGFSAWLQTSSIIHFNGTSDFVRLWAFTSDGNVYATTPLPMIHGWLLP